MADSKIIAFAVAALVIGAAAGIGAGFVIFKDKSNDDQTYYFYIDFGDNDTKTGWYSAKAGNADDALAKAVDGKEGITLTYSTGSSGGYPNLDTEHKYWYSQWYIWDDFSKAAADKSLDDMSPGYNGWMDMNIHLEKEKKLDTVSGTVFYFAPYDNSTWAHPDVGTSTLWKTAEGTPFATA